MRKDFTEFGGKTYSEKSPKYYDLKIGSSDINWNTIFYMDMNHVHKLTDSNGFSKKMLIDMDTEILKISKTQRGQWKASIEINPKGINKARDGARFDFTLFG